MMNSKLTSIFRSALLAALAFTPLTASLHAQVADRVQVNIPFDFQDGAKTLPAGIYTLTMQSNNLLIVRGAHDGGLVLSRVEGTSSNTPNTGKVVFQRYGDKYFLREVWQANEPSHTICIPSNAEKQASKAQSMIAAGKVAPDTIELALLKPTR